MITDLILVRHGETEANTAGIWQGQVDGALSDVGKSQARAMGQRLKTNELAAVYSSDLARAHDTAKIIVEQTGHDITLDSRLRERHFGVFQGLTSDRIQATYPEKWVIHRTGDPDYVIPDGESSRQRDARSVACLEEIAVKHSGQTVLVVAHGGVLNGFLRYVLGIPPDVPRRFAIPNAVINEFRFDLEVERWRLVTWGEARHLEADSEVPGD